VKNGGTANGTLVQLYSCNGNVDQEWKPRNGTKLQIWQMNGGRPAVLGRPVNN
jgi:hypothetical protein